MLDNNGVLSKGFVDSEQISEALLSLIYIAVENDISLDLCLNNKIDELIKKL